MRYLNAKGDIVNFHTPLHEVTNYFPAIKLTMSVLTITPEIRLKAERLGVADFKKYLGNAIYSGNCLITATLEPATSSTDDNDGEPPLTVWGDPIDDIKRGFLYNREKLHTVTVVTAKLTALIRNESLTVIDVWKTELVRRKRVKAE